MKSDTLTCGIDVFLRDYGPSPDLKDLDVLECKSHLLSDKILEKVNKDTCRWKDLGDPGLKLLGDRTDQVFTVLPHIVKSIFAFAEINKVSRNTHHLYAASPIRVYGHDRMDMYVLERLSGGAIRAMPKDNIMVPWHLRMGWKKTSPNSADEQILEDCYNIIRDDARRMYIYGVTIEDNLCSIWYFSRSHSVKTTFDWISNDGLESFIRMALSFACATPKSLGVDPRVHKVPACSDDPLQSYVYELEVPKGSDNTLGDPAGLATHCVSTLEGTGDTDTVFFRTVQARSSKIPYCISGRATRIWEVVQVCSVTDIPAPNAQRLILKDVWLDVDAPTECENQRLLFAAVDDFVAHGLKTYPGPDGMIHLFDNDPRFKYFNDRTKSRLAGLLTDSKYKDMFLTEVLECKGEVTRIPSHCPTGRQERLHNQHVCLQKQQVRIIYKEVCTEIYMLPTLGAVMDIIRQALDALEIFFCTGWLHRDISAGNIMAFPSVHGQGWQVKVGDLEFARVSRKMSHRLDPIIGTPFFMPVEIMQRRYFSFDRAVSTGRALKGRNGQVVALPARYTLATLATRYNISPDRQDYKHYSMFGPDALQNVTYLPVLSSGDILQADYVNHNYQHDLESLWWIILYFIAARIDDSDEVSKNWAKTIFKYTMEPEARENLFSTSILHKLGTFLIGDIYAFIYPMEDLRKAMYDEYVKRVILKQTNDNESYSYIHGLFAEKLDSIIDDNLLDWKGLSITIMKQKSEQKKYHSQEEVLPTMLASYEEEKVSEGTRG